MTSSVSAIYGTMWKKGDNPSYSEEDFSLGKPNQKDDGYSQSIGHEVNEIANFRKEHPECQTHITCLNPASIVGPLLTHFSSSSVDAFKKLAVGELGPFVPKL